MVKKTEPCPQCHSVGFHKMSCTEPWEARKDSVATHVAPTPSKGPQRPSYEIREANLSTTVAYMEEAEWEEVFVVWLNGCTDGWPRAIFYDLDEAYIWLNATYLNPEGYLIEKTNFGDLCRKFTGPWLED